MKIHVEIEEEGTIVENNCKDLPYVSSDILLKKMQLYDQKKPTNDRGIG